MTCLCLTRNRRKLLRRAISCFRSQTHPNRELLILADGEDVRDLVPADAPVRLLHLSGHAEIGAKRNLGCERAAGEIIAHWDDDDWSAPERLDDQVARLLASGRAVTGYRSMRFTDGARWWLYRGAADYALGTSLCFRRAWWERHRFPALQIGEDNEFVRAAAATGQLETADAGELMWATIHAGNTSPRRLSGANWAEL